MFLYRISFFILVFCVLMTGLVSAQTEKESFRFEMQDGKLLALFEGDSPVLSYRYDMVEHEHVPKANGRRWAGCYVHPLYGLNGEILTENAPKDHFHHHGIFWTWPHVGVHLPDGNIEHYDLWESCTALKQHFVRWVDKGSFREEDATARFEAENGWFIGDPTEGRKIMSERVHVVVHQPKTQPDGLKTRCVDFQFTWTPTDHPISLRGREEKSYGGFTVRFRPYIPVDDAEGVKRHEAKPSTINVITVPDGITDRDLPETPLAWADYTSRFGNDEKRSGAAIFVPKTHPDFPPTWLTRHYGAMCVGWPGIRDKTFQPGEEIKLNYRIWIHNNPVDLQQIKSAYDRFNENP